MPKAEIKVVQRTGDDACVARQINQDERTIRFLAQSARLASDNLVITAGAGKRYAKEYMRNPIVVPYHRLSAFDDVTPVVVGNVVKDEFMPDGRYQTVRFATTELAEQWWHLYAIDKVMRMVSIAWYRDGEERITDPGKMVKVLEKHGITLKNEEMPRLEGVITQYKQRDLSLVPIGADPDAMQHSADAGNQVAQELMRGYEASDGGLWVPRKAEPVWHGIRVEETTGVAVDDATHADPPEDAEPITTAHLAQLMEQVRSLINDTMEPIADQVNALAERMAADIPQEVGEDESDAAEHVDAGEAGDAPDGGEPDDAGNEANAHQAEAEPMASPYAELLDMGRNIGNPAPQVNGLPGDLLGAARNLAGGLKSTKDMEE